MAKENSLTVEQTYKLERNLKVLFWLRIFSSAMFTVPIIVLYYQSKGFSLAQFFVLQPIFSLIVVAFEIPVSYISDIWSRKSLLLIATMFSISAVTTLLHAETLAELAISFSLAACAHVFSNSTNSAILFDTLLALNKEHEHKKRLGNLKALSQYGLAFSAIVGGILFSWDVDFPAITTLLFYIAAFITTLYLYEPPRTRRQKAKNPLKDMLNIAKYSLHGHSEIKWIIIFSATIGVASMKAFWLIQPLFQNMAISVIYIGAFSALCRILNGVSSQFVHCLENITSMRNIFIGAIILSISTYLIGGLNIGYWAIIPIMFAFAAGGGSLVLSHDLIHQRVSSDMRATVISVEGIVTRLMFAIVTPIFGWLLGAISLQYAMTVMGIFVFILAGLSFIMLHNKKVI